MGCTLNTSISNSIATFLIVLVWGGTVAGAVSVVLLFAPLFLRCVRVCVCFFAGTMNYLPFLFIFVVLVLFTYFGGVVGIIVLVVSDREGRCVPMYALCQTRLLDVTLAELPR